MRRAPMFRRRNRQGALPGEARDPCPGSPRPRSPTGNRISIFRTIASGKSKPLLRCLRHDPYRSTAAQIAAAPNAAVGRAAIVHRRRGLRRRGTGPKEKMAWGSAQPVEKARFRTRKCKRIQAFFFDRLCSALSGFCWILLDLESAWKTNAGTAYGRKP